VISHASVSTSDFKNGLSVEIDQHPYKIVEFLHVKPGKGAAFVRSKIKSYLTGNTVERTFRAGETIDLANIEKKECQFTYVDGDSHVFMDNDSFEEVRVLSDSDWSQWLMEGGIVTTLFWNGKCISVEVPISLDLKVVQTDPGLKGNTAQGGTKPATLETGAVIQVPLFIVEGEIVKVNTIDKAYVSRAGPSK